MEKLDFNKIKIKSDLPSIEPIDTRVLGPDDLDTLAMEEPMEDENSLEYILSHGTKIEFMNID